ncbi:MAG: MBL fold metallo-hydrolase RNA specificity domain-containing protein [Vulcanimicrobiota bacterium]
MTTLSFLGAARTVTGSRHLIMHGDTKILVDSGMFQGLKELRRRNWEEFMVPASEINYIILTHAHIDHSGYIPRLVKQGFKGKIITTQLTHKLCEILLRDSAYLQEEEARYANKKGFSKHKPALPLYTVDDAQKSLQYFYSVNRNEFIHLTPNIKFRFRNAGHILGSSIVEMWIQGGKDRIKLAFSGDLGRLHAPLLKDPEYLREADFLILEATYGDRIHPEEDPGEALKPLVKDVYKNRSCLLIPAFAVERTQEVIYHLRRLALNGEIPNIPIYIDSPMAIAVTKLFSKNSDILDKEAREILDAGEYIFRSDNIHFTPTQEESKQLNERRGPMIIISASGMATGGRILHHLKERISDPKNIILMVGYQAVGTRGRSIVDGAKTIKIHGSYFPVRARVETISSFSAHADYNEILKWLRGIKKSKPKTVFLVHGENDALISLEAKIKEKFGWNCYIPDYLETVKISPDLPPPPESPTFLL